MLKLSGLIVFVLIVSACSNGYLSTSGSRPNTKIFKYSGSLQCEEGSGVGIDAMKQDLIDSGIDVICSQEMHDGLARAAFCGNSTGQINVFEIHNSNLPDTVNLGFSTVDVLSQYQDEKCEQ